MKILVIESDQELLAVTSYALAREGHRVIVERRPEDVLDRLALHAPDLILLDATIDGEDGLGLCRAIRTRSAVPLMIVSPCRDEDALVRSYEAGADDYVIAPFSPRQILLRIAAVMRRCGDDRDRDRDLSRRATVLSLGDLEVDRRTFEVRKFDSRVPLTRTEYYILAALLQSPGTLVESARLADSIWEEPPDGYRRLLKTHMSRLRQKLLAAGGLPVQIRSISRVGYILTGESEPGGGSTHRSNARPAARSLSASPS